MEQKFCRKVNKTDSCWLWTGRLDSGGYGRVSQGNGQWRKAHRVSYELFTGSIPEGLVVRHLCNVRACVNPEHLAVGTHKDNVADMDRAGRRADICGEKNPMAKFTEADIAEIRQWREFGFTQQSIADAFGATQGYISSVCSGKVR